MTGIPALTLPMHGTRMPRESSLRMDITELWRDPVNQLALWRITGALVIGGLIGIERSHHGRPAGFRTHALVCMASTVLMFVSIFDEHWLPEAVRQRIVLDPTRVAQGIMTGIGFLGAGTIVKEGLTIQGLTTAASIWITAALGVLIGVGLFGPAVWGAVLTIGTLAAFRSLERLIPVQFAARVIARFGVDAAPSKRAIETLLREHGFAVGTMAYRYEADAGFIEYRLQVSGDSSSDMEGLSNAIRTAPAVQRVTISMIGD